MFKSQASFFVLNLENELDFKRPSTQMQIQIKNIPMLC